MVGFLQEVDLGRLERRVCVNLMKFSQAPVPGPCLAQTQAGWRRD